MKKEYNEITYLNDQGGTEYLTFAPFEKYDWLTAGFSTRRGGVSTGPLSSLNLGFERGDEPANVDENWKRLGEAAGFDPARLSFPNQWHTNNLRIAGADSEAHGSHPDKDAEAIDGQVTDNPGTVLVTYGADCTPVYLIDPEHRAIGLSHSGWKGSLNNIALDTVRLMTDTYAADPGSLIAMIGPSISSDNYEVGPDVADPFCVKFGITPGKDTPIIRCGRREGKFQLDLWEAVRQDLLIAGLRSQNIYTSGICTFKEKELMYSHRRDGNARGVMAAFMSVRK